MRSRLEKAGTHGKEGFAPRLRITGAGQVVSGVRVFEETAVSVPIRVQIWAKSQ